MGNSDELLGSAEFNEPALTNQIDLVKQILDDFRTKYTLVQTENEQLKDKVQTLTSENRALHLARDRLAAERASDKEKIRVWQARLNEIASESGESTQSEHTVLPSSSPPRGETVNIGEVRDNAEPKSEESLSQRMLPMSLAISEAGYDHESSQAYAKVPQFNPFRLNGSAESIKREIEEDCHEPRLQSDDNSDLSSENVPPMAKRKALSEIDPNTMSKKRLIEDLKNRDWHPADFKINPKFVSNASFSVERNKTRRKCLHGTDCPDCSKFYAISGMQDVGVQTGSRHRFALDKIETPPGYWDIGFSETNQSDSEKTRVKTKINQEGQVRLLEALAQGRYLFKDDKLNDLVKEATKQRMG